MPQSLGRNFVKALLIAIPIFATTFIVYGMGRNGEIALYAGMEAMPVLSLIQDLRKRDKRGIKISLVFTIVFGILLCALYYLGTKL